MTSSHLGRKKYTPHKTIDQKKSKSGNETNKIINTGQHIPEIMLMVIFRS